MSINQAQLQDKSSDSFAYPHYDQKSCLRTCAIRSVCILGGSAGGYIAGIGAGSVFYLSVLFVASKVPALSSIGYFMYPLLTVIPTMGLAGIPAGAIAGHCVAKYVLHRH